MKAPRRYFDPLAIGAPRPLLELPSRLERMIHFIPPHNEKVRAKAAELVGQVDVVLGNLEDAIPIEAKLAARDGLIAMAKATDFGSTGLWARVNALNSPWFLDDMTRLVGEIGDKLDVVMVPKIEGDWDIHFVDQYLALLEARNGLKRPILVHAILETAQGVNNVEAIAAASPRMQGMSLGPADLAASRAMKTTRVGGGHPDYRVLADATEDNAERASFQQDPWHYTIARMVDACAANGIKPFYGPFGDFSDPEACEAQFRNAFLLGCAGAWTLASEPDRDRQKGLLAGAGRSRLRAQDSGGDAGRIGRGHDRRKDAGRRDLETGAGHRRSRPSRWRRETRIMRRSTSFDRAHCRRAAITAQILLALEMSQFQPAGLWASPRGSLTSSSRFGARGYNDRTLGKGDRRLWKVATRNSESDRSSNTGSTHSAG